MPFYRKYLHLGIYMGWCGLDFRGGGNITAQTFKIKVTCTQTYHCLAIFELIKN